MSSSAMLRMYSIEMTLCSSFRVDRMVLIRCVLTSASPPILIESSTLPGID